jgi:fructose-bisphosphate aldolase class II
MAEPLTQKVLDLRPARVRERLGDDSRVCLINSKDILRVLKDVPVILMACNTRIKHVIPGIMRAAEELDAVVGYELAKSECDLKGGYTGFTPDLYFKTVTGYAAEVGLTRPFFIHGDHITVKDTSSEAIEAGREVIKAELEAGYTSFAIDASFNPIPENIRIATDLAQPILAAGIGLEVEVGEIGLTGTTKELTTVGEATSYIEGLAANGVHPDMLAVNNGSKHGNYHPGEEVHIDLKRTGEIYEAIKGHGVVIAQHGITGTPMHLVGEFADYGIRKGNVGTHWQNVAHAHMPPDLMTELKAWAEAEGKNIKMATKPFKDRIDSIPDEYRQAIAQAAYESAKQFIVAFRAQGTGSRVIAGL